MLNRRLPFKRPIVGTAAYIVQLPVAMQVKNYRYIHCRYSLFDIDAGKLYYE